MPISPTGLLPGTSPLPTPGQRPPDRHAARLAALVAIPVLLLALILGSFALPRLLFIAPAFQAQAGGGDQSSGAALFQGFLFPWTRGQTGGGYNSPASAANLRNEAHLFHMNAVIIQVFGDMAHRDVADLAWHVGDAGDIDTLPDAEYVQAIKDAQAAGLTPILELEIRQRDTELSGTNTSAYWVGKGWFDNISSQTITPYLNAQPITVGQTERQFMDSYTAFAVHYAQLSQTYHLPYFIIGDQLASVSYDTPNTVRAADPAGVVGGPPGCTGRRDCEWRHLISAVRTATYTPLTSAGTLQGASYTGKLIYSAYWNVIPGVTGNTVPEFQGITWWDAVDYIGVDARFPLTRDPDVSVSGLSNAWHGVGSDLAGQGDIYSALENVSAKFGRPVIFTEAGYESVAGSNGNPGQMDLSNVQYADQGEQASDMEALLATFSQATWWQGVFWDADEPLDYAQQPQWQFSSAWANSTLATSKLAGQYLASYYQNRPLH